MQTEPINPSSDSGNDDDPGNPLASGTNGTAVGEEFEVIRSLANYGAVEPNGTGHPIQAFAQTVADFFTAEVHHDQQLRTMPLKIQLVLDFLNACQAAHVDYGLHIGNKVPFHGAVPGVNFKHVDCSGFVREAIWRGTDPHLNFVDGSAVQHEWIIAHGFTRNTIDEAMKQDGAVRIAFLSPHDSPSGIGHVALVYNGRTIESHGGVGPDRRPWTKTGWQSRTQVYYLTGA